MPDGKTALAFAAMFDRVEIVDVLLAAGADPHRRDNAGQRAIDLARLMGATATAALPALALEDRAES
jgi:hypothetical protein